MKRRAALAALGSLVISPSYGQRRLAKVGVLTMGVPPTSQVAEALREGLREHGYVDGRTLSMHYRFANGDPKRMPALAAELMRLGIDIVVIESYQAAVTMKEVGPNLPIVIAAMTDPVRLGLAASYSQPGGNITGLTLTGADRIAKQLQVLKELIPTLSSVAFLYNSQRPDTDHDVREATTSAQALRVKGHLIAIPSPTAFEAAFTAVAKLAPEGLVTIGDGMLLNHHKLIAEFVVRQRLPAAFPEREYALAGGLLAYGPSIQANFRRAASFVDRILKGAKPGELPIEHPSKFDLVLNVMTAKRLGLKIPAGILVRADEVIQ